MSRNWMFWTRQVSGTDRAPTNLKLWRLANQCVKCYTTASAHFWFHSYSHSSVPFFGNDQVLIQTARGVGETLLKFGLFIKAFRKCTTWNALLSPYEFTYSAHAASSGDIAIKSLPYRRVPSCMPTYLVGITYPPTHPTDLTKTKTNAKCKTKTKTK